ncbi:MAG TPA: hydroxymethylglutaryl-CoA lyase [Sedimentibacter sp.]|nr:hydroxymethylglutaryl-CoA lyase [Sedimentibacter sp.]HPB80140.1 hydroxymethylglutaryl-CoA lyase [Sedimentibacter sp.]HPV85595.1 hydroxymethylglutaryl-CoA lyase [Sedimentibacter sp.]HQO72036.1 hydroxymethylglutaryl-CoA lyase [Sedimentibacter sp.]HQO95384.1 hydroxymethylglutaryl-CoA lyase [Sedimentibacter sp.]
MILPSEIRLCEVGLRDGLQNEPKILTTEEKLKLAEGLINAGFKVIELGSFMSPKAVPQMADTDELFRHFNNVEGVELRALVANKKGVERAINCGCGKIKLNVSASKKHNLANINKTPEETVAGFAENVDLALENGLEVSGSISMPFGSPWEGVIPIKDVEEIVEAYLRVGIKEISLSDAAGVATPRQVYDICSSMQKKYPDVKWWLHFHNTRGMAMANILASMEAGITNFDSSLGGFGGCPFVPGAAGNVSTEDVVHMMDEMGIKTGIDILKLIELSRNLQDMLGNEGDSYILKAGRTKDLFK